MSQQGSQGLNSRRDREVGLLRVRDRGGRGLRDRGKRLHRDRVQGLHRVRDAGSSSGLRDRGSNNSSRNNLRGRRIPPVTTDRRHRREGGRRSKHQGKLIHFSREAKTFQTAFFKASATAPRAPGII